MYVTLLNNLNTIDQTPITTESCDSRPALGCARFLRLGATLFREGDEAEHIYEVKSGVVRLTRVLENGRRQVIAFGYPGDFVGFPNGDFYHADCDVLAPAELVAHRRSALERAPDNDPTRMRLLKAALAEISAMQDHFMMLACKSATEKVASFLEVLSEKIGTDADGERRVHLSMRRADIADFLGLTTETVSRTFTQLRKEGIIDFDTAQTVIIRDATALSDAAETD